MASRDGLFALRAHPSGVALRAIAIAAALRCRRTILFSVAGSNWLPTNSLALLARLEFFMKLAPRDGFEPPTNGLTVRRSTTELPGNAEEARIVGKRRL
jgi:hypothetical protein